MTKRKNLYLLFILLLPFVFHTASAQTNRLYVNDLQLEAGSKGMLEIYMENTTGVVGFQFTMTVPDGITLLPKNVMPSSRLSKHELVAQSIGVNKYMFAAYSSTNEVIGAIQGLLFTIPIEVASDIQDNVKYELSITSAVMGTKNGDNVLESVYGGKIFVAGQPNLHVTSVDCSDAVAGQKMTVTWRVRNDGVGPTGDIGWKDYVWLTPDIQGGMNMTDLKLLKTIDNVTVLQPGEWYDNSIEVELEERKYGKYHIVVTSDMYGFDKLELSTVNNELPEVYQPEMDGYLFATGTRSYDLLAESGESKGRSDNFFYKRINIAVPPLPNLKVSQVVAVVDNSQEDDGFTPITHAGLVNSTLFYSGKHIKVTARIANTGEAPVSNAVVRDALYMSKSEDMTGEVYRMADKNDTLNIQPGEEQLITFSTQLPYVWSDDTWFHVQVDTKDVVYEGAATTDNIGTGNRIDCLQTPTADFKVTSVSVPKQVTLGVPFDVTYKVQNIGPGIPFSSYWTDRFYISDVPSVTNASIVESHRQSGGFVKDEKGKIRFEGDNYTATRSVTLRNLAPGAYYLFVKADTEDDVYEFDGENNNQSEPVATLIVATDLTAELLSVSPDTLYNNSQVTIKWKVKNIGNGNLQNIALTDAFYATAVNSNTSHYLGRYTNTVSIASGNEKVLMANITLPNNRQLSGDMSVFVKTNINGVVESTTGNNTSAGIIKPFKYEQEAATNPRPPISIDNRPNLVVANVTVSASIASGQEVDINYVLKNLGAETAGVQVKQEVYLSPNASFNNQTAIQCYIVSEQLSSQASSILLKYNTSLNTSMRIKVPDNIRGGKYYLHVIVNGDKELEETKYTDNSAYALVNVSGCLPDLEIRNLSVPLQVNTSVPFNVAWTVENVGTWEAEKTVCDVWLTADKKPIKHLGTVDVDALAPKTILNKSVTIQLDDNLFGEYDIMVVADSTHRLVELSRSNNRLVSHLAVTQSPLPNLQLSNLEMEGRMRGGDTITVTALVKNIGYNSTHKEKWSDAFYLSTGYDLDTKKDIRLGGKIHIGELAKNGSYVLTVKLCIPKEAHGYYLLYAVADDSKTLIESSRTDNMERMSVCVEDINDRPAQLTISHIVALATVTAGEMTSIKYSVENNGLYPATGTLRDAIYLSTDNKWDENDIMIGVVEDEVDILPGQLLYRQAMGRITNVMEGEYYVIVRTNSTHSIVESDYDDNMNVETSTTKVEFYTLQMGASNDFYKMGYFKVPVQSVGQSATIGFSLTHDTDQQTGLYVSYERVPSTARYDYASSRFNTNRQEVLIPNIQPGTYYVLAQRNNLSSEGYNRWSTRNITSGTGLAVEYPIPDFMEIDEPLMNISVRDVQFGATQLSIREGGTEGWVTTDIQGALFDSIMDFRLVRDHNVIPIETLTFNDQTSTRVTFNLNRAETGVYDVVSELPDGTQATLPNGFTVVPGVNTALGVKIDMPHWVRVENYVPVTITYANSGNTDVVIRRFVFATNGGDLSTTIDGLTKNPQHELTLLPDGKQDSRGYITIPPNTQGTMRCYFKDYEAGVTYLILYLEQ